MMTKQERIEWAARAAMATSMISEAGGKIEAYHVEGADLILKMSTGTTMVARIVEVVEKGEARQTESVWS